MEKDNQGVLRGEFEGRKGLKVDRSRAAVKGSSQGQVKGSNQGHIKSRSRAAAKSRLGEILRDGRISQLIKHAARASLLRHQAAYDQHCQRPRGTQIVY